MKTIEATMAVGEKTIEIRFNRKAPKSRTIKWDVRKNVIQRYLQGEFGYSKSIEQDIEKQIDAYIKKKNIKHSNREYIKNYLFS
jgi:hypothetical protein